MSAIVHHGDCRDVMRAMEAESFHACVTDPPYGLSEHRTEDVLECLRAWLDGREYEPKKRGFMGKAWDGWVPGPTYWREVYRVLKPGAHLVCFAGARTGDLMGIAIRLAGFEVRDTLSWNYGSGFPKSHNLDGDWDGYGTALKPAWEPIILARKPLRGTVAANVQAHGCGALAIDACRIGGRERTDYGLANAHRSHGVAYGEPSEGADFDASKGRWPANLILGCACSAEHDPECAVAMLDAQSGTSLSSGGSGHAATGMFLGDHIVNGTNAGGVGDFGGASRFFYVAKATRAEREAWLEFRKTRKVNDGRKKPIDNAYQRAETQRANTHPTVKPVALMRWLVKLVGGKRGSRILDPFCGSGTTGIACALEGFAFDGIDLDAEHCEIARARIAGAHEQAGTLDEGLLDAVPDKTGPVQLGLLGGSR